MEKKNKGKGKYLPHERNCLLKKWLFWSFILFFPNLSVLSGIFSSKDKCYAWHYSKSALYSSCNTFFSEFNSQQRQKFICISEFPKS